MLSSISRLPWLVLAVVLVAWLPAPPAGEGRHEVKPKLTADGQGSASAQFSLDRTVDEEPDGELNAAVDPEADPGVDLEFDAELEPDSIELVDALEDLAPPPLREGMPVGKHTNGYLVRGREFPIDDDRFAVIAPWRAYCAQTTIDGLFDAVDAVEALYPGSHTITVGDCSRKGGGPLSPHMSHQTGLDIDIGPYWADGEARTWLEAMHPQKVDIPRTWALLEALVSDESVKYIILDYRLQQVFYEYAQELPWMDQEYLELIFQYPRGPKHYEGIIRHWEGHYSHIHVRFHCPEEFADTCVE